MDDMTQFAALVQKHLLEGSFHKLSLGKPGPEAALPLASSGRPVELKSGLHLALTLKSSRNETIKNLPAESCAAFLAPYLGSVFRQADLFTSQGSWHLLFNKRAEPKLLLKNLVTTKAPDKSHDKSKTKRLDLGLKPWPLALGLIDSQGRPVASMKDKIHQVEKFLELVEHQLKKEFSETQQPQTPLRIMDLGAGRGYLSFALYQWLTLGKGWKVELEAVEVQEHLVVQGNATAKASGFTGLKFIQSRIDQVLPGPRDMVIALHACDTATDDALALGVRSGARWLFAAPCCHQELRAQMHGRGGLGSILNHGILLERQAEILTEGLRALVLEGRGYETKVIEFVPAEHTGKNLLIIGRLKPLPLTPELDTTQAIKSILGSFGIQRIYLQSLLELEDLSDLRPHWRHLGPVAEESRSVSGKD